MIFLWKFDSELVVTVLFTSGVLCSRASSSSKESSEKLQIILFPFMKKSIIQLKNLSFTEGIWTSNAESIFLRLKKASEHSNLHVQSNLGVHEVL